MLHLFGGNDLLFVLTLSCYKTPRKGNFSALFVSHLFLFVGSTCEMIVSVCGFCHRLYCIINILCSYVAVKHYVICCVLSINLAL